MIIIIFIENRTVIICLNVLFSINWTVCVYSLILFFFIVFTENDGIAYG